ncbi:MAG TPA: methyltransferase domain-containing protein [Candidatus Baltobacteraceae bacterium]|nr:methyltransferase domain-containing protein [Candidatus Baltobacteraceae bacterium]
MNFACARDSDLSTRVPNWREQLTCESCKLPNRARALLDFIDTVLLAPSTAAIYVTEETTPLFRALAGRYPQVVGSEFLRDGTAPGERNRRGIVHQDLTALSFGDETFDVICSADVLEHVADYKAALAECFRCLRQGGRLVISVPFLLSSSATLVRATVEDDGTIVHHLPAEYHGDPLDKQGILCYYHFGWDLLDALSAAGFRDRSAFAYWSYKRAYLGSPQILICATKTGAVPRSGQCVSSFYDTVAIAQQVAQGRHRDSVGGRWDEIGRLQFEFLVSRGLSPRHKLIDIGCGCLRGGVHFVRYLEPGNYFGIDINQSLLDAGYDAELAALDLQAKLPRANLLCGNAFEFAALGIDFDFGIAQSLFTHLPWNHIRLCLTRLAPQMAPSGKLFATAFIVPDDHPYGDPFAHGEGVVTNDHCDPYHYRYADFSQMCQTLPWRPVLIGDWGHPRGQTMVAFELRT